MKKFELKSFKHQKETLNVINLLSLIMRDATFLNYLASNMIKM